MAHFAELDENSVVTRVIVVSNADMTENGVESEQKGIEFCKRLFGQDTNWVQTSYNGKFRKRYASPGCIYSHNLDAFVLPRPYPSWVFNEQTCDWEAPVPIPTIYGSYWWDESTLSWKSA